MSESPAQIISLYLKCLNYFKITELKEEITQFIKDTYGFEGVLEKLRGYAEINYLLKTDKGTKYVIKLISDPEEKPLLQAQNEIICLLENKKYFRIPELIKGKDGGTIYDFRGINGQNYLIRILNYIEGKFLAETSLTEDLLSTFGSTLALLDKELENYRNPVIEARRLDWDTQYFPEMEEYLNVIDDPSKRKLISYFLLQYGETVEKRVRSIYKSIIHNDANDWNIIIDPSGDIGIIDFGDIVYTHTINELAIAAVYIAMRDPVPLNILEPLIRSYHQVRFLSEQEIAVLYYLMASRMCISVCMSAKKRKEDPDNHYAGIHEEAAWDLLEKWIAISPAKAENIFYNACGLKVKPLISSDIYLDVRRKHISNALSISYEEPLIMESATFQYMFDSTGRTYLDCINNIMHVGHCHPEVVRAGCHQMSVLNTNTRYLYHSLNQYAEELLKKFPPELSKVFFVNSGSAASDLAVRLARAATGRKDIIVMEHGYHGHTVTGTEISHYKFAGRGGKGPEPFIHVAPIPDAYRGKYQGDDPAIGHNYAALIDPFFEYDIAAFISEPVVGCGGQIFMPEDYLPEVYQKIRSHGGICIADEVQTGFGRIGKKYWAFQLYDVMPDIVVLGKPMGNGHPLGAVICTDTISHAFETGMEFFSSFGGNPVSCEIGRTVLRVIDQEGLKLNADEVGKYIMNGMYTLKSTFPVIGDIRGSGLFIGIELVTDPDKKTPAAGLTAKIINKMRHQGFLLSIDGPDKNVIKIKPPMCIAIHDARALLETINKTFEEMAKDGLLSK